MSAAVRMHRLSHGLTLDQLATAAGVTKSYLSKVERGKSSPSIAIAMRIAQALDVDAAEIFAASEESSGSVRVEHGAARSASPEPGTAMYVPIAATVQGKHMHPFWVHPSDAADGPLVRHAGDEFLFVASGSLELTVDDEVHRLTAGDTAYFAATRPHRLRSLSSGADRATAVVVTTVDHHSHNTLTGQDRAPR